jgi:HK97 family phage portal protein
MKLETIGKRIDAAIMALKGAPVINPTVGSASISISGNMGASVPTSGVYVSEYSALALPTVWACINVLSQTIGSLPLQLCRLDDQGRPVVLNHPVARLFQSPNPEQTPYLFKSTLQAQVASWGNAYAEIERDRAGRPIALWPIMPWRVFVRRVAGVLCYDVVLVSGGVARIPAADMLHIRALSNDGVIGIGPIQAASEAIGLGLAAQASAGRFYAGDSQPSGVLEFPGKLEDDARKRLRESWSRGHEGIGNHHRIALLEEGMKFTATTINPDEAQLVESRKLSREEVAQIYRMPPHKVGVLERSTNNNIEQQNIEFTTDTIKPWVVNWEDELDFKLLTPTEQLSLSSRFDLTDIMRGDITAQTAHFAQGRQWGWYCVDEIRAELNLPELPDGKGQIYLQPVNMAPAGYIPAQQPPQGGQQ